MEVWKDYITGRFYSINPETGRQSPSNRYGNDQQMFTPYSTGFPRMISKRTVPIEKMYTVQPSKFDGYCQFPRPMEKRSTNTSPYARLPPNTSRVYIKDQTKIPQPLEFLNKTHTREKSFSVGRTIKPLAVSMPKADLQSIEDIKLSLKQRPSKELSTVSDLTFRLENEKKKSKGYERPKSKVFRRKLKGFFLKEFKTSGELFDREKKIREATNPALFVKLKKFEELDRKMLEKKCQATKMMFRNEARG